MTAALTLSTDYCARHASVAARTLARLAWAPVAVAWGLLCALGLAALSGIAAVLWVYERVRGRAVRS